MEWVHVANSCAKADLQLVDWKQRSPSTRIPNPFYRSPFVSTEELMKKSITPYLPMQSLSTYPPTSARRR